MSKYQMPAGIRKAAVAAAAPHKKKKKKHFPKMTQSSGAAIGTPSSLGPVNTNAAAPR